MKLVHCIICATAMLVCISYYFHSVFILHLFCIHFASILLSNT